MKVPKLNLKFIPRPNLNSILRGKRLNKKKITIISSVIIALIIVAIFFTKFEFTAFSVKEENQLPACISDCSFEGKTCENGKIFECILNEDGCKYKTTVEFCPEGSVCSTINKGICYTPQTCNDKFHICVSDFLYMNCEDGKTVEDAETKKCPEDMMCNRNPKQFAICVRKDY